MLLLIFHIFDQPIQMRLGKRHRAISPLPLQRLVPEFEIHGPSATSFELLNQLTKQDKRLGLKHQMNMGLRSTHRLQMDALDLCCVFQPKTISDSD